jgi:hypothetical protein
MSVAARARFGWSRSPINRAAAPEETAEGARVDQACASTPMSRQLQTVVFVMLRAKKAVWHDACVKTSENTHACREAK